jgi:hypothetical protein
MCRRSDSDPLVRALTDRYKLNILRLPRRGVGVGELLIREDGDLRCAGNIKGFFDPELDIPPITVSALPDIDEITSSRRSVTVAAAPLIGLLTAVGAVGLSSIDASLREARDVTVAFSLTGTQYCNTPLLTLGAELNSRILRPGNALHHPGQQYFIAYAAATATGMRVAYSAGSDRAAKLMLEFTAMIKAETSVDAARGQSGHFDITSSAPVTFGLAVARLVVDGRSIRLETSGRLHPVRKASEPKPGDHELDAVFFGGSHGDVLVEIS